MIFDSEVTVFSINIQTAISHCDTSHQISGVGSVAAIAAMAATLFWPKNQSLLNGGNRAYINKL